MTGLEVAARDRTLVGAEELAYDAGRERKGIMSELALAEGSIFVGRYQIVRCIAMGGMGAVYEVIHRETERRHALKVMLTHALGDEDLRNRFRQEARVTVQIESEFIVDVSDAGIDEATHMPFIVMELLKGEELGKRLKRLGRFQSDEVVTYLHQTALALDKTHRANIVHRDLKPANLFLTKRDDGQPRIKVLDFGIAKMIVDAAAQANATSSLGTPLYMAPEQFRTELGISPQTDIYSLGMVAFTLLVGLPYWHEESSKKGSMIDFVMLAVNGPPEPATIRARRYGVELPPAFDAWFAQATAPVAAQRFRTAGQAVQALSDALGIPLPSTKVSSQQHANVTPPRPSEWAQAEPQSKSDSPIIAPPAHSPHKAPSNKTRLAVGLVATLLLLGVGAFLILRASTAMSVEVALPMQPILELTSAALPTTAAPPPIVTPLQTAAHAPTSAANSEESPSIESASFSAAASGGSKTRRAPTARPAPTPTTTASTGIYLRD